MKAVTIKFSGDRCLSCRTCELTCAVEHTGSAGINVAYDIKWKVKKSKTTIEKVRKDMCTVMVATEIIFVILVCIFIFGSIGLKELIRHL